MSDSNLPAHESVGAIILCGGRSERMGSEKSSLLIDGQSFLRHICEIIRPHFRQTVVVAAARQLLPDLPTDVCVVRDFMPDAGPLAGLLTGLEESRTCQSGLNLIWLGSCDSPFVSLQVIDRMLAMADRREAVVVRHSDRIQPFGGVYRTDILQTVRRLIEAGERRLHQLPLALNAKTINAESLLDLDPKLEFLRNINTPDDYQRYVIER